MGGFLEIRKSKNVSSKTASSNSVAEKRRGRKKFFRVEIAICFAKNGLFELSDKKGKGLEEFFRVEIAKCFTENGSSSSLAKTR